MATVGQIYYNVQLNELQPNVSSTPNVTGKTFWGDGWPTGTAVAQNLINPDAESGGPIYNYYINHLGIQGPPGLVFTIGTSPNDSGSHFMLGRTGVFELEDEIYMLKIEPVQKYTLVEKETQDAYEEGTRAIAYTIDTRTGILANSEDLFHGGTTYDISWDSPALKGFSVTVHKFSTTNMSNWTDADWQNYRQLEYGCDTIYAYGLSEYLKGVNGVYKPSGYQDIKNLIIDYSFG